LYAVRTASTMTAVGMGRLLCLSRPVGQEAMVGLSRLSTRSVPHTFPPLEGPT
jgi:hypothetical protein